MRIGGKGLGVVPVGLLTHAIERIIGMLRTENGKSRRHGTAKPVHLAKMPESAGRPDLNAKCRKAIFEVKQGT